ncbi:hypothetical protein TanjilG_10453 [Lupinus angustifolius]|uniref:Uncharacterized protein n=1 Tax=Lupinus angustifolius TaxID=3871 RepID=A0A4P1R4B0_LUPAN|nr:hypothetical protein TanjilG_10453 [Lupinus angustifolius]
MVWNCSSLEDMWTTLRALRLLTVTATPTLAETVDVGFLNACDNRDAENEIWRFHHKKPEGRSRIDRDADNLQLHQLEEKGVVSSVATVLSDLCGPGEWMPMEKLHAELVEQYSSIWHHSRVRRYLTSEEWPGPESKGKPWYGLLMLLRKYPEHFVINTRSKGRVTLEFVSLVSLLS